MYICSGGFEIEIESLKPEVLDVTSMRAFMHSMRYWRAICHSTTSITGIASIYGKDVSLSERRREKKQQFIRSRVYKRRKRIELCD